MKKINISSSCFITILLLTFLRSQNSFSEEKSGPTEKKNWNISVGYGFALKNNIRKDNNYSGTQGDILFKNLPLVQISWGPISIGQHGLSANVFGNKALGAFININRVGDRYKATGLTYDRKESWFIGGGFQFYKFDFIIGRDIDGHSHGVKTVIHYTEMYPLTENIFTRSAVGIECFSQSYADYYYGVMSSEVSVSRSEYHPKQYCNPTVSFFPGYKYNQNLSFISGLNLTGLASSVRKSPTTNGAWIESALIFGGIWKF